MGKPNQSSRVTPLRPVPSFEEVQEDPQILIKIDRALIIALTLIFLSGTAIDKRVD
jgi:hypothetical protein